MSRPGYVANRCFMLEAPSPFSWEHCAQILETLNSFNRYVVITMFVFSCHLPSSVILFWKHLLQVCKEQCIGSLQAQVYSNPPVL